MESKRGSKRENKWDEVFHKENNSNLSVGSSVVTGIVRMLPAAL